MKITYSGGTRVLLCQPWDYNDEGNPSAKYNLAYRYQTPHYGLVLLATLAQKAGHIVKILDAEAELVMQGQGVSEYILTHRIPSLIKEFHPDIVGISCSASYRWPEAYQMAKAFDAFKQQGESFKLILGGHHITSQFEDVFRQAPFVDWVHIGESEKSFLEVLSGSDPKQVNGIAWLEEGQIYQNPLSTVEELDELPYPDWSLLDLDYYTAPNSAILKKEPLEMHQWLPVITSRGCSYRCAFCTYKYQKFRNHSGEYIGEYMDYILRNFERYKIDALYCAYDAMVTSKLLHSICKQILKRKIHKKAIWIRTLRTNITEEEDLVALKKAGCVRTLYGFESGSNRILERMNKHAKVEDHLRVARYHHKIKLDFQAVFIFGYPGETFEDVQLTQELLQKARPTSYSFGKFVPMPGSTIFDELKNMGKIQIKTPWDYRRYSEINSAEAVNFSGMDNETFERGWEMLLKTAYEISHATLKEWAILQQQSQRLARVKQIFHHFMR